MRAVASALFILTAFAAAAPSEEKSISQAPRTEGEAQTINVYKRANRAVLNVNTRGYVQGMYGVTAQEGTGSGVVVDSDKALAVTNYHVIEGAQRGGLVVVTLEDGRSYQAKLVGTDPDNDIALLQIVDPPPDLTSVEFGDSSTLEVGQRVFAIGNPFGLNRTLTEGIISALERSLQTETGREIQNVIQTDAAINPGNSGGPLLDSAGRLIGINSAIISNTGQSAGIGFAIPANVVRETIPLLLKYHKVPRPKIGVVISNTQFGPVITFVKPGSPADKAGLSGAHQARSTGLFSVPVVDVSDADFILSINGQEVQNSEECYRELSKTVQTGPVELVVRRGLSRNKGRVVKVKPVLE